MKNILITTSIAYVNAAPHVGFAMELVQADAIARWHRAQGDNVFFLTGTDEHGTKIFRAARDQGVEPQALCDQNSAHFRALGKALNISNEDFIRTTDERHKKSAKKLWERIFKSGDLQKQSFQGLYCAGCEAFITEKDLIDGKCPNHLKAPETLSEENWFFALSRYSDEVISLLETGKMRIFPDYRKNEILELAKKGLTDVSFSRPRTTLPWGVDVPNDHEQVMYVWCDALTNYISALGYASENDTLFRDFWEKGEVIHLIGKDILRFHAGIWPAMLASAGVKPPDKILVHGFLTSEGQKMSKSLGNVVDPFAVVAEEGVDALRFFLLHEVPFGRDADFSRKRFSEMKNAVLADSLGNLLQRVYTLARRAEVVDFPMVLTGEFATERQKAEEKMTAAMAEYALHDAIAAPFAFVAFLNQEINRLEPWKTIKTDPEATKTLLAQFLESLRHIARLISPFLPETAEKMRAVLGLKADFSWGEALGESVILFPKEKN